MTVRELGLPARTRIDGLPDKVTIYEVGPRDGLQNEKSQVDAAVKVEFIARLADAGLTTIEATSFVHPKWVPQLADAEQVLSTMDRREGVDYPVLVPNELGLTRAIDAGVDHVAVFASATETFANKNLNNTLDGQFDLFEPVVKKAREYGMRVRGYVSMCWGDPWEGAVDAQQVVTVAKRLHDMGCEQISLGDTIGVATAGAVQDLLNRTENALPLAAVAVHFHDTYGQALANTLVSLQQGVATVDASAGGLGGCPYAKSATGNLATEDLVWMLDGLGIDHGVNLDALVETSVWMASKLGKPSPSGVVKALG